MKTFEVVEGSRFMRKSEMTEIKGGDWTCSPLPHSTCDITVPPFEQCGFNTVKQFSVENCDGYKFTCLPYQNCKSDLPSDKAVTCSGIIARNIVIKY